MAADQHWYFQANRKLLIRPTESSSWCLPPVRQRVGAYVRACGCVCTGETMAWPPCDSSDFNHTHIIHRLVEKSHR